MANPYLRLLPVALLCSWAGLMGCLSIEEVPRVSAPGSGDACFDRGVYTIGLTEFRGLPEACTGPNACVNGVCNPLPPCAPTQDAGPAECIFTPQDTNGAVSSFAMSGEHVYWIELGSFDSRSNYQRNGTLARARIGEWQREELDTNIDFYGEATTRTLTTTLHIQGGYLFLSSSSSFGEQRNFYRSLRDDKLRPDDVLEVGCVQSDQQYWVEGRSLFMRALNGETTQREIRTDLGAQGFTCGAVIGQTVYLSRLSSILAVNTVETAEPLSPGPPKPVALLIGSYQSSLVVRTTADWLSTVVPESGSIIWKNVVGGTAGSGYTIQGDYVYWYRNSASKQRKYEVILRGRLDDGDITQEVVAEAWDQTARDDDTAELGVGSLGVGWWSKEQPSSLHFHPLPASL